MSQRLRREDTISNFPDSLLDHILSFLPTKDAVATSILSKRWKSIWRSQLILYLDDDTPFCQFFDSFITTRDNTLSILSFHLKCRYHFIFCTHHFHAAITRRLQTLIIDLLHPTALPSTSTVLTSKTLTVLKLKGLTLNDDFPSVHLPSLKLLRLKNVSFKCFAHLHKLLLSCPILHELESYDLRVELPTMMHPVGITISSLVRASVSGRSDIGLECLHNVVHLYIYANWMPPLICGVFHNLTHLKLKFKLNPFYKSRKWIWLIRLLPNTPNLQTLIIHEVNVDVRYIPPRIWEEPKNVPDFLLSHLTACSLINYPGSLHCEVRFAKYIMQNSRLLSTMTIQLECQIPRHKYKASNVNRIIFLPKNFTHI